MTEMIYILSHILLPIFLQIAIGYVFQKKFKLDIGSLTKVQLYILIPPLIFTKIAGSELEGSLIGQIVLFTTILFFILLIVSTVLSKLMRLERKKEKAFINALTLRNQGNYGIPLISLAFAGVASADALSIHMVVMFMTNILLNTIGLYNASSGSFTFKETIVKIFRLPIIYAILLGFVFKSFNLSVYKPIQDSLDIMSGGVVPLALFTLGAQLAETKLNIKDISLSVALIGRLILSPFLAYLLTLAFGIEGMMAQVLILGAAAPTAVNSVLLAIEFDGDYNYASQAVMLSTLFSLISVTTVIQLIM